LGKVVAAPGMGELCGASIRQEGKKRVG
jgi:hypothetical protein